jgi:hypothetical protein
VAAAAGSVATAGTTATGGVGGSAGSAGSAPLAGALPDITFTLDTLVPAGKELLECEYVAMPSDRGTIAVPSAESHFTPGSHHLLAYRTDLTTLPTDQVGVWDCTNGGWAQHDRGSYYEAQQPDSHRELPPGVAHEFKPGEVLLLQSHYVNTTDADVDAHVVLTLHTVDISTITQEAGSIIFSNANISIAPHSKLRVTMTCPIPSDFHPAELWSHMHKDAVNFVANTSDTTQAAVLGDSLYQESDWSEPQPRMYPYDPPVTLHAGSTVTFSCDFDNETDNTITYGDSALTNEMCILHGMYWPRMASSAEMCMGGKTSRMVL